MGASVILSLWLYFEFQYIGALDHERRLFINKTLVRDGQSKIFGDAAVPDAVPKPAAPLKTPFQAGLNRLKETVQTEKAKEAGSYLPDEIKQAILRAKQEAGNE